MRGEDGGATDKRQRGARHAEARDPGGAPGESPGSEPNADRAEAEAPAERWRQETSHAYPRSEPSDAVEASESSSPVGKAAEAREEASLGTSAWTAGTNTARRRLMEMGSFGCSPLTSRVRSGCIDGAFGRQGNARRRGNETE